MVGGEGERGREREGVGGEEKSEGLGKVFFDLLVFRFGVFFCCLFSKKVKNNKNHKKKKKKGKGRKGKGRGERERELSKKTTTKKKKMNRRDLLSFRDSYNFSEVFLI